METQNKYACFLRGINVSGKNKILMKELTELLTSNGFSNVITYIQSGNIVLESDLNKDKVESTITNLISSKYGYTIPCTAIKKDHLVQIVSNNTFINDESLEQKHIYFTICNREITKEDILTIKESKQFNSELINCYKDTFYLFYPNGYGKTKIHNNYIENKLKLSGTTRNLRTMNKMVDMMMD